MHVVGTQTLSFKKERIKYSLICFIALVRFFEIGINYWLIGFISVIVVFVCLCIILRQDPTL